MLQPAAGRQQRKFVQTYAMIKKHVMNQPHKNTEQGFSLLELSIFLLVLSSMMAGFLFTYGAAQEQERIDMSRYANFTITDGLAKYLSRNGRFPCPSSLSADTDAPTYGEETDCTDTSVPIGSWAPGNAYYVTDRPAGSGFRVRIGAIPFKTIGIGREDVIDAYKNRITYVITESQATAAYTAGNGRIEVLDLDNSGAPVTKTKDLIFFSHGLNEAGSFSAQGIANGFTCNQAGLDQENCDLDGAFITNRYARTQNGTYDDDLVSDIWRWVYVWDQAGSSMNNIYNRIDGDIGIGTDEPSQKLHIKEGNLLVEDGNVESALLCDPTGAICFAAGQLGSPTGMRCPNGRILRGIAENNVICSSVLGDDVTGSCDMESFVSELSVQVGPRLVSAKCKNLNTGATVNINLN